MPNQTYAALLREDGRVLREEARLLWDDGCDESSARLEAIANRYDRLAALLERVTPEVVREASAQLFGYMLTDPPGAAIPEVVRSPKLAECDVARGVLIALAAGPQPEEGRDDG